MTIHPENRNAIIFSFLFALIVGLIAFAVAYGDVHYEYEETQYEKLGDCIYCREGGNWHYDENGNAVWEVCSVCGGSGQGYYTVIETETIEIKEGVSAFSCGCGFITFLIAGIFCLCVTYTSTPYDASINLNSKDDALKFVHSIYKIPTNCSECNSPMRICSGQWTDFTPTNRSLMITCDNEYPHIQFINPKLFASYNPQDLLVAIKTINYSEQDALQDIIDSIIR